MAESLYKPRPDHWFQFSLRTLFSLTTASAVLIVTVLPGAIATYHRANDFAADHWSDAPGQGSIRPFECNITCGFGDLESPDDDPGLPEDEADAN